MKIFTAEQIRRWDAFTIEEENISSSDLMERAARACVQWIEMHFPMTGSSRLFHIFCGKGNNGGDGLAIARMLIRKKYRVQVWICETGGTESRDFSINFTRLDSMKADCRKISAAGALPSLKQDDIIVDALFGTGLNKPLSGIAASLAELINRSGCEVISIDIPSGMMCDRSSRGLTVVHARHTLSFSEKLCFMMAENEALSGIVHLIDIGASRRFPQQEGSPLRITDRDEVKKRIRARPRFGHKGTFGSGAMITGSYGMIGAAVLAAKGFIHSGAGKLTCFIPACGYTVMQASVPEAMCRTTAEHYHENPSLPEGLQALGIGPGIGDRENYPGMLKSLFNGGLPMVIDADALNCIGKHKDLISEIPKGTIITPHPKEFERMFGNATDDFDRLDTAIKQASALQIFIILKGHRTAVVTPEGTVFFNSTGNPGMAKPGTGDVLTGLLTGLLAQGYDPESASILGVYLHGLAGDIAAGIHSEQSMTALDIIDCMGRAWKDLLN